MVFNIRLNYFAATRKYFSTACETAVKPKQAVTPTNDPSPVSQSSEVCSFMTGLAWLMPPSAVGYTGCCVEYTQSMPNRRFGLRV